MRSVLAPILVLLWCVACVPVSSWAQGAIAGVVHDTSGGVLPGVTVEAASPALIEKVRQAVTDAQGQYKIVDLRPGALEEAITVTGETPVVDV